MACCCHICHGRGVTREDTDRGTVLTSTCYRCGGSGGWDEVSPNPAAQSLINAAARRHEVTK